MPMEISSLGYLAKIAFFFKIGIVAVEERRRVRVITVVFGKGFPLEPLRSSRLGMNFLETGLVYVFVKIETS